MRIERIFLPVNPIVIFHESTFSCCAGTAGWEAEDLARPQMRVPLKQLIEKSYITPPTDKRQRIA